MNLAFLSPFRFLPQITFLPSQLQVRALLSRQALPRRRPANWAVAQVLRPNGAVERELVRQSRRGQRELPRPHGEPGGTANAAALGLRAHAAGLRGQLEETQEQGGLPREQGGHQRGAEQKGKEVGQDFMQDGRAAPLYSAFCKLVLQIAETALLGWAPRFRFWSRDRRHK